MGRAMDDLNHELVSTLREPLRIGVAIHVGPVIGDTVNTASRFEGLNKQYRSQLVISDDAAARAGLDLDTVPRYQVEGAGRTTPVVIRTVPALSDLEPLLTPDPMPTLGKGVAARINPAR
jgi:adenylate cyclase